MNHVQGSGYLNQVDRMAAARATKAKARKKCPRCHSSMLLDFADAQEAWRQIWKCLGCGREIFSDDSEAAEDDRLLASIRREEKNPRRARM